MKIKTLFIANRGEIAVRIIRAAQELGIRTVQAYSAADKDSLAVRLADEAIDIGPAQAAKSYLNIPAVVAAATRSGADAVHPGYGFLAENADFADAVEKAGLIFVGPTGQAIRLMGDKVSARNAALAAGVPVVPGSAGRVDDLLTARDVVARLGFPVMIKAAAGGGGRGIRIVGDMEVFERLMPQARAEALAAFGDGGLFIEKLIELHCFERDCSLQRRRQKVWEEAPSVALPARVREALCASAIALAKAVRYRGAGTLEYLYDDATQAFYFIEMNTRIQVEHPVTEMITGLDLVRLMIQIAGGERLSLRQDEIRVRGHSIQVRINAEDPANNFAPFPGKVETLMTPGGNGVRFDTMLFAGYQIPPFYDSLLGKLIVWDDTRDRALARLTRALRELEIGGCKTTKPLHLALAEDPEVRAATYDTRWLERRLDQNALRLT